MSAKIRLFLSSYVPLFAIGAIRTQSRGLRLALVVLAVAGLLSLLGLIRVSRRLATRHVTPTHVRTLGSEVAGYVASYILPFLMAGEPDPGDLVTYLLALGTISIVYVQSDLIGINPLLYLLGYRVYAAEGVRRSIRGSPKEAVVISRLELDAGIPVEVADLAAGVALVRSSPAEVPDARP
jgi:hypothetical protein